MLLFRISKTLDWCFCVKNVACGDLFMPKESWPRQKPRKSCNATLNGLSFSCGSPLQDLDMDDAILSEVYVQDLQCGEPVEPHYYYAANFKDIYLCLLLRGTSKCFHIERILSTYVNSVKTRTKYLETSQSRRAKEGLCFLLVKFIFNLLPVCRLLNEMSFLSRPPALQI